MCIRDRVDTGGIEPKATEGILAHMREQAQIAIDTADCIIMVVDVRNGLTAADEDVAHMLRTCWVILLPN